MKILILGGTRFLGRNLVEIAMGKGHEVTLFNRGKTNPDLFPEVEHLKGERDGELTPLKDKKWDVVIDTCGYVPRIVKKSAELLADSVEHYTFISSINAYIDFSKPGIDENAPLATMDDETVEEVTNEIYGPLKVLCEKAVEQTMPGRVLVLRPGLIVGPYDPSDRFTYWPVRISAGEEILAPSPPHSQVQFIDVRDLVEFILYMAEQKKTGIFNTTGPEHSLSIHQFLEECIKVTKANVNLIWVKEEFLTKREINLPVWVPKEWIGINQANCKKAIDAGLKFRPLSDTIHDTLKWHNSRPSDFELKSGLKPEREKELLKIWYKQKKQ